MESMPLAVELSRGKRTVVATDNDVPSANAPNSYYIASKHSNCACRWAETE